MSIELPREVPVMTLPEVAFFPRALLPLYIFEPRYRQMLRDVLAGPRLFAVTGLDPEGCDGCTEVEPPYLVASVGVVRASHANADGTSHLVLEGLSRVRIEGIVREEPYRVIRVEPVAGEWDVTGAELEALRADLGRRIGARLRLCGEEAAGVREFLESVEDGEAYVDLAASILCCHAVEKQRLLETLALGERYRRLIRYLGAETARLKKEGPVAGGN